MTQPLRAAAEAVDLPVAPMSAGETRQAWVYRQLRESILRGALPEGARVPSTRAFAERLRVSRSTVEVAFDQLRAEGYVTGRVGSGTYVCAALPERYLRAAPPAAPRRAVPASSATVRPPRLGAAFVARVADPALFPMASWRRHLQAAAAAADGASLVDDDPFGATALRVQVARYLGAARGIVCEASQVVIVSGIRQGLDLAGRVLLRAADKVLLEDPGYMHAAAILGRHARRVVPLPIDEAGFSVARARRHAQVRLACVTPAHQSPTGVTMPVSRRLELLAWARERGAWLLEDDYDSEFSYRSAPLPALKSLDEADRVVHCGSFNKTMFSALRIGYLVVPRTLVPEFAAARNAVGRCAGAIEQHALAAFIADGGLARHVRRTRGLYALRRERVLAALREAVAPAPLDVSGEHAGFHFLWRLPPGVGLQALAAQAEARGLRLESLAACCRRVPVPDAVMMGDCALDDAALDDALDRLREAIAAAKPSAASSRRTSPRTAPPAPAAARASAAR